VTHNGTNKPVIALKNISMLNVVRNISTNTFKVVKKLRNYLLVWRNIRRHLKSDRICIYR